MRHSSPFTVTTTRTILVRRKKRRAHEGLRVRHQVPVVLEQLEQPEFPLAVRLAGARQVEYRSHKGRIFTVDRVLGMPSHPAFPVQFIANAFAGRMPTASWHNPFLLGGPAETLDSLPEGNSMPADVAEVLDDPRRRRDDEIARIATRYVIFDGHLWVEAREPAYAVVKGGRETGAVVVLEQTTGAPVDGHMCFRLNRLAEAQRFAGQLLGSGEVHLKQSIAHLDPALLIRDDRLETARSLRHVTLRALEGWLGLLDPGAITDWVDLRDCQTEDPDELGRLVGRLLRDLERLPLNQHGRQAAQRKSAALAPALLRWTEFEGGSLDAGELSQSDMDLLGVIA